MPDIPATFMPPGPESELDGTLWAAAKKLQFVVEVNESSFFTNLLLQFVDGARCLDGFDTAAFRANEIVTVHPGNQQGEVGGPFMEAKATNHALVAKTLEESENGCFVTD